MKKLLACLLLLGALAANAAELRHRKGEVEIVISPGQSLVLDTANAVIDSLDKGNRFVIVPLKNNIYVYSVDEAGCKKGTGKFVIALKDGTPVMQGVFGNHSSAGDKALVHVACGLLGVTSKHVF